MSAMWERVFPPEARKDGGAYLPQMPQQQRAENVGAQFIVPFPL